MPCGVGDSIGWIVGESTPVSSLVIFNRNLPSPVRAGDYLVAEGPEGCVLGIVEIVWAGHRMLPPTVTDPEAVDHIAQWTQTVSDEDLYNRGKVRWLSILDKIKGAGAAVAPKTPIQPGTKVYRADPTVLQTIFSPGQRSWIRLGHLANDPSVEFHIDANGLTRHLAILAVTGGGKSNTVCILAKRIVGDLCGTMVIFDMHGEYSNMKLKNASIKTHKPPKLNPSKITRSELFTLTRVGEFASRQKRYLSWAWRAAVATYEKMKAKTNARGWDILMIAKRLLEALYNKKGVENIYKMLVQLEEKGLEKGDSNKALEEVSKWLKGYLPSPLNELAAEAIVEKKILPPRQIAQDSLEGALARLDDLEDYYSETLDVTAYTRLVDAIPPCTLTVFDLSELDENAADALVSHYLKRILMERKAAKQGVGGYKYPVIVVLEEAHILVPRDNDTLTKYWAARIAREGRKFGVGLVLVSQRPKNVDPNVLSQTNNKIILRMVEPEDIRYVQRASEEMSDDIASLLPSLNPGEAVVLGKMAKLPALVKIDLCPKDEKPSGGDIDIVAEWLSYRDRQSETMEIVEGL